MEDVTGHLRQVVRVAALVCFWAGVAFGFYWLTYRTPEEIKIDEQRAADAAQKAKEQSDDTDRQTYARNLPNRTCSRKLSNNAAHYKSNTASPVLPNIVRGGNWRDKSKKHRWTHQ
jgi:hypothetical protein